MEDQGKRLLLAVAAAFAIMLLWTVLFPPEKPEKKEKQDKETATKKEEADKKPAPKPDGKTPAPAPAPGPGKTDGTAAPVPETATCDAQPIVREFEKIRASFSPCGGVLMGWELKGAKFEDRGKKRPLDLAPTSANADTRSFATSFKQGSTYQIPANATWRVSADKDANTITFTYPAEGVSSPIEVVKEYRIFPDDYLLQLDVRVRNLSSTDAKQTLVLSMFQYQDPDKDEAGGWTSVERRWKAACLVNGDVRTATIGDLKSEKHRRGTVKWGGFVHSYFLAAAAPKGRSESELECNNYRVKQYRGVMRTDLVFETSPPLKRSDEAPYSETVVAYLGPKYLDKLEAVAKVAGFSTKFEEAIDLGWFSFIARPMLWLLQWFQSFVINWGLAIILLTVLVKLATLYWTNKSMRSMKAMAKLKPEIEKLQKKYKDDKQRQQVEIMNLYKTNKVNPLAGCLPMLLQMPIWFALYKMLMAAAELYQAPFVPGWIDDLTAPDPYYVLPILLMGTMFLQSKLTPSTADSTQQKIMMYGLPLMFGVFSFFFPSGLTLYILTNTVLTAGHHLWMNREDHAEARAVRATGVAGAVSAGKSDPDDDDDGGDDDGPTSGDTNKQATTSPGARPRKKGSKKRSGPRKKSSGKRSA